MYPQQIIDALQHVRYPGTGKNLIEGGMLEDNIRISGMEVSFSLIFEKDNDPFRKSVVKAAEAAIHTYVDENAAVHIHSKFVKQNMAPKSDSMENLRAAQVIAIHSGKGGVGKSTVAANLAIALAKMGYRVGLLDADIHGPSVPKMFHTEGCRPISTPVNGRNLIEPIEQYGVKMLSIGFFVDPQQAVVWRGGMASNAIKQLIQDANWGELDYFLIDLPPGTSDIHLTLVQHLHLTGAIVVTTPQPVALVDARKGVDMFELLKTIYKTEGNRLTNIRVVGFVYDGNAEDLDMLAHFADDTDADGNERAYNGIDADGKTDTLDIPVIEGVLNLDSYVYEDVANTVRANYPNLVFQPLGFYVSFEDPVMLQFLLNNLSIDDGVGLTIEQIESLTSIPRPVTNTSIKRFNEFERFINVASLPNQQNSWNYGFFRGCTGLEAITIPPKITEFKVATFGNCTSLQTYGNLHNIKIIGARCFESCLLTDVDVYLPSLTSIGAAAYYKTKIGKISSLGNLTAISNSEYLDRIDKGVFRECVNLTEATLPDSLETIGSYAFYGDTALATINYDWSKLVALGASAFYNCPLEFDELNLPNLTTLGENAFYGVKIKKLNLGALTTLPWGSTSAQNFGDKSVLEEIIIPETVTSIGNGALYKYINCVIEDLNLPNLTSLEGGAFNGTKLRKITSLGSVSAFPTNANSTGSVFDSCTELTSVAQSVFENIVTINSAPFDNCTNLYIDELIMPNLENISRLGNGIHIRSIKNLGKITELFGSAQLSTSHQAFGVPTYIEEYYIPASVTSIGRQAFRGMSNLKFIVCNPTTPPVLNSSSEIGSSKCPIYVPDESVEAYKTATNWSAYASRIYPMSIYENGGLENVITFADPAVEAICLANWDTNGDGYFMKSEAEAVTSIGENFHDNAEIVSFDELQYFNGITQIGGSTIYSFETFANCTSLKSIVLPSSCKILNNGYTGGGGRSPFYNCKSLETIGGLENVTFIGANAFNGCTALATIDCDWSKIVNVGESAFNNCTALSLGELHLDNLESIAANAFAGVNITKITLGKITSLPNGTQYSQTFGSKTTLEEITIPSTVTDIPQYTLFTHSALKKVIIEEGVQTIGLSAIRACSSLPSFDLPSTINSIGEGAFAYSGSIQYGIIRAVQPPTLVNANAFVDSIAYPIYVPDASVDAYKEATNWSSLANRIKPLSEYNG